MSVVLSFILINEETFVAQWFDVRAPELILEDECSLTAQGERELAGSIFASRQNTSFIILRLMHFKFTFIALFAPLLVHICMFLNYTICMLNVYFQRVNLLRKNVPTVGEV